jgi:hypothetical protein
VKGDQGGCWKGIWRGHSGVGAAKLRPFRATIESATTIEVNNWRGGEGSEKGEKDEKSWRLVCMALLRDKEVRCPVMRKGKREENREC